MTLIYLLLVSCDIFCKLRINVFFENESSETKEVIMVSESVYWFNIDLSSNESVLNELFFLF